MKRHNVRFLAQLPDLSKSAIKKSFLQIAAAAEGAIADTNIERGINMRLRTKKPTRNTKDQRWLTECRVITGADVEALKAAGGVVGINKAKKKQQKETSQKGKKKASARHQPTPLTPLQLRQRTVRIASSSPDEWFEILSESDSSSSSASIWSDTIIVATPNASLRRRLFPTHSGTPDPSSQPSSSAPMLSLRPRHQD